VTGMNFDQAFESREIRSRRMMSASNPRDRTPEPPRVSPPRQLERLDEAIALLATGLRVLLSMDLPLDHETQPSRSNNMIPDALPMNGNERYEVLIVEKYEDATGAEKANWTRIGVAFPHKDGLGLNVELKAIPVSGKLIIRRHGARTRAAES